jgi:hypothetical protein
LLLADNGFVRKDGNASLKHLVPAIRSKYSKGLLEVVQCGLDENKHFNWPFLLLPHITHGNTDPPIRHLLFFQLLGSSAEAFFCRPLKQTRSKKTSKVANRQNQKPFGTGPWSCLNPVCKEYRKLKIKTCTIGPYYRKPWRFMATFACTCGFTYRRIGPDNSPEMCYRFIVQQRGTVWESYLQNAWADSSMNGKAIALKLNISWSNLKSIAIRMGLPFPRHAATQSGSYMLTSKIKPPPPKSKPSFNDYRTMHRKRWLTARKQHPSANRRQLHHELAPGPLYWLSKYDKKWLLDHSPPPVMGIGSAPRIDWNKRDVRLAAAVHASALRARNASSPSIRITTAAITREVGELRSLRSKESRDKLPLAAKALREVLEGPIDFAIRKIERAANELLQEGTRPGLYPLRMRAAVHSSLWYVPEISAAFDKALQSLMDADSESQAVEAA